MLATPLEITTRRPSLDLETLAPPYKSNPPALPVHAAPWGIFPKSTAASTSNQREEKGEEEGENPETGRKLEVAVHSAAPTVGLRL
jgi:hypothetical protein